MKLSDLRSLLADVKGTTTRVRDERLELARHRRAMQHPAVAGLPAPFRAKAVSERRTKAVTGLQKAVANSTDLISILNGARRQWSPQAYVASARLFPLPDPVAPPAELDTAQRATWQQASLDRTTQRELLEVLTRRAMVEELRELDPAELGERLRELDPATERGAAELQLIGRELRRRPGDVRAKLQDAYVAATARVTLPEAYQHAAALFAELDTVAPLLEANWDAVRTGDDKAAHNFEHAHFIIAEKNGPVSLAETATGRLMDRERWEAARQAEAQADTQRAHEIARGILKAAAGELIDIPAPQSA